MSMRIVYLTKKSTLLIKLPQNQLQVTVFEQSPVPEKFKTKQNYGMFVKRNMELL